MAWPIVIATNGMGIPVTESASAFATPVEIAANGYGTPVVMVASGGLPVKGATYQYVNAEASALAARFTTPPTYARAALIDTLVGALKTAGVWAKLDALYVMAAADSQAARQNWIANLYNATAVSGPSFTADRGYTGNNSSSYVDTNFNPATAAGKFQQNSAYFMVWSLTNQQGSAIGGWFDGTDGVTLAPRTFSDVMGGRANQPAVVVTPANTDSRGQFSVARSSSSDFGVRKNGVSAADSTTASTALNNNSLYLGRSSASSYSNYQMPVAAAGQYLTPTEDLAAYTAINTYLQAVGAV